MDVTEIKKIMGILESTDLSEISLESEGTKVLLKKDFSARTAAAPAPAVIEAAAEEAAEDNSNSGELISLNIGKFYLNSKLGAGAEVKEGEVIGYIESIGLKTDVKSDKTGVIKSVLVENGGIVQFGQPIMIIEMK